MKEKKNVKKLLPKERWDVEERWEKGISHHPKALEFKEAIKLVEKLNNLDLNIDFGGDGDIGEEIMFALSVYYDYQDALKNTTFGRNE